jgi:hypothetical protein
VGLLGAPALLYVLLCFVYCKGALPRNYALSQHHQLKDRHNSVAAALSASSALSAKQRPCRLCVPAAFACDCKLQATTHALCTAGCSRRQPKQRPRCRLRAWYACTRAAATSKCCCCTAITFPLSTSTGASHIYVTTVRQCTALTPCCCLPAADPAPSPVKKVEAPKKVCLAYA